METYDLHIWFMDDREICVVKIHEHFVKDNVLHCFTKKSSFGEYNAMNRKIVGSYPIYNIRTYLPK